MIIKNIAKETVFKSYNINKPYTKMYCPEYNSLLLLIKNNRTIVFYKCCIGHAVNEELKTVTFDEIYNAPDPYNYILEVNKIFAKISQQGYTLVPLKMYFKLIKFLQKITTLIYQKNIRIIVIIRHYVIMLIKK